MLSIATIPLLVISPSRSESQTPHEKLAREVYAELVGINTMDSVGSTTRAAQAMAKRFIAAGFPTEDVQVLTNPADTSKANLVVRYRGSGGANGPKPILLLAHLDVVAALRSDWSRDPFQLQEDNGFFYGRGTSDDKAMGAIFVANLLTYKAEGWKPNRDLILALTAAEEGGANNGVEWLIANRKSLIDAAYAINEGGGGTLTGTGMNVKPLFNSIQAAEKVPENFTLTVRNSGGHSSVPRPDNAIYSLANGLVRLGRFTFPVALNPVSRGFFEQTAKVERPEIAAAMRAIVANPADSSAAATLSRDPRYASMLRTTCVATRLAGGHANNALPQTATANVNCRIVPTSSAAETQATLERIVADTSIKFSFAEAVRERFPTSSRAIEPELLAAATELTRSKWGDIPVIPVMSTGATDGRFLRAAGIPTYGVSGIFSLPGETNAHGRDEKLRTKSFYDGLDFLDKLVRRLAGGHAH
ncbi:MAG TPA: M20/M25/M40 family metallo-hydrolase [Gemmatimonadaceae bacterium]|jgi:acetylornithine deacetylase/succinyl-diaminopimelate desuccinylase-like protein|nr:M20/M25/M40 family metallo-hydrolase [Gemmatimonadaceae bacterium]